MPFQVTELLPFLTLGLLGAGHCAAMCGGFAMAVSGAAGKTRLAALLAELAYVLGKAITYAVLGLGVAQIGSGLLEGGRTALGERAAGLAQLQTALSWLAGGTMVWLGLRVMGLVRPSAAGLGGRLGRPLEFLRRLFRAALDPSGGSRGLTVGLVTGILPCGLSWGALALCLTLEPVQALLGMFVFGLGTAPVLILVGLGWRGFSQRFGPLAARAAGPLLVTFGVLTALRGTPSAAASVVLPECCVEQQVEGGSGVQQGAHRHP